MCCFLLYTNNVILIRLNYLYLDPQVAMELLPWKEEVDKLALQNVGTAKVHLTTFNCNYEECNMGNIIADSFVDAFVDLAEEGQWTYSAIAVINVGSIRTTLDKGGMLCTDFQCIRKPYILIPSRFKLRKFDSNTSL